MFRLAQRLALVVGLVGCGEAGTSLKDEGPDEVADDGPTDVETFPDAGDDQIDGGLEGSTMLLRRAELRTVDTPSAPVIATAKLAQCAEGRSVGGVLSKRSALFDHSGGFGMLFDAYIVTALVSGSSAVFSEVSPGNAETYQYGYGFPFTLQAVDREAPLPGLSTDLVRGMSLADNALDDGKARLDLTLEAGKQYVLTFKNLYGGATPETTSLNYTLTFCGTDLRVEGKLWISDDESDLIASEQLSGPITLENAHAGAMAQLARDLQPAP